MQRELTRRQVLGRALAGAAALGALAHAPAGEGNQVARAAEPAATAMPWYRRLLVGIEVGPTGANRQDPAFMARATGKDIIDHLRLARAEYGAVFMKDMEFAYYNSKAARKCPGLGDRDLLRECLDEAKKHGLPIVAYCQVQYDTSTWNAHPEWRMKDHEGKDIGGRLCFNSGYLEYIKEVTAEMMAYEIAGFHIDMLDFGFGLPCGCFCDTCRREFRKRFGSEMPKGITWDEAWDRLLRFRCDSNTRFCRELQAFIRSRRPDVSVDFNYHGYPPFSWHPGQLPAQHAANGDFVTAEGLPWVFGHNNPSLLALFMAGARPGGPVQGVTSRSVFDYHDFTVRPTAEMTWEVLTYLAHGAQCTIVDKANYDGTLDRVAYQRMGEVFAEAQAKREYFGHRALAEVGLFYSSRSRDWYGRENPAKYMAAFWGAHRALVQAHLPMGVICDEGLTLARLRDFPVVYLAGTAIVSESAAAMLDEYVTGGGNLLVTGVSGLYDRMGRLQANNTLAKLLGVELVKCHLEHSDNYVRLPGTLAGGEGAFLLAGVPADWPILTWGPVVACKAAGAQGLGELLVAHRTPDNPWSWRMSPKEVVGPAVFIHRRGKGTAIYVPCAVDAAFVGDYRVPEHRNLIANLVRRLNPSPPVVVEAPRQVEIVVTRDEARRRTLVHLLCFSAPATFAAGNFTEGRRVLPPQMEEPIAYTARIRLNRPFSKVRAAGQASAVARDGNVVRLQTAAIHEVVLLEE
jgi:hypothetical protein